MCSPVQVCSRVIAVCICPCVTPLPCFVSRRNSYRMEDWLHFVETHSLYVFKGDVLPAEVRSLWWDLRDVILHHFRPYGDDVTREQFLQHSSTASAKLMNYARTLEDLCLPGSLHTLNLHICVCR